MRTDIAKLQQRLGTTAIYVTHERPRAGRRALISARALSVRAEAIPAERVVVTGNTVVDAVSELLPAAPDRAVLRRRLGLERDAYIIATVHRPENVDDRDVLATLLGELRTLPLPVLLPLHLRTARRVDEFGIRRELWGLHVVEPMPCKTFIGLAADAALLVLDSGGVQEEASVLKRPVLVVRRSTERPEVIGTYARLVGPDGGVAQAACGWLDDLGGIRAYLAGRPSPYGAGQASASSAEAIRHWLAHQAEVTGRRRFRNNTGSAAGAIELRAARESIVLGPGNVATAARHRLAR